MMAHLCKRGYDWSLDGVMDGALSETHNCANLWATAVSLINMSVCGNKKDKNIPSWANWEADIKEGFRFITPVGFWQGSRFNWDKGGAVSRFSRLTVKQRRSIQSRAFGYKSLHGAVKLQPLIRTFLWTSPDHPAHAEQIAVLR